MFTRIKNALVELYNYVMSFFKKEDTSKTETEVEAETPSAEEAEVEIETPPNEEVVEAKKGFKLHSVNLLRVDCRRVGFSIDMVRMTDMCADCIYPSTHNHIHKKRMEVRLGKCFPRYRDFVTDALFKVGMSIDMMGTIDKCKHCYDDYIKNMVAAEIEENLNTPNGPVNVIRGDERLNFPQDYTNHKSPVGFFPDSKGDDEYLSTSLLKSQVFINTMIERHGQIEIDEERFFEALEDYSSVDVHCLEPEDLVIDHEEFMDDKRRGNLMHDDYPMGVVVKAYREGLIRSASKLAYKDVFEYAKKVRAENEFRIQYARDVRDTSANSPLRKFSEELDDTAVGYEPLYTFEEIQQRLNETQGSPMARAELMDQIEKDKQKRFEASVNIIIRNTIREDVDVDTDNVVYLFN